jgi:hypothetical protein
MKSDAVKLEEKKEKISSAKKLLEDKIAYAEASIGPNSKKIIGNMEDHMDFINFAELMKIYELYKWKKLKGDYSELKKKINLDKKIYLQIIKIYSNIVNYLSDQENSQIGKTIRKIQADNDTMIYDYLRLQHTHRDISNKCKYLIRNNQITKIYDISSELQPVITKLHVNYMDIKIINKKAKKLKTIKSIILDDIQRITGEIKLIK